MKKFLYIISALFDCLAIAATFPLVRQIMLHSPLFDAAAPQWSSNRYLISGIFAAATYFLLALVGGFYSSNARPQKNKIPTINFGYFIFLFLLGWLACWRFADISDGQNFISKRALLFALTISYFITTFSHYLIALFNKKEEL